MEDVIVRIINIKINNFKNVKEGKITLKNYNNVKKSQELIKGDLLGIYGQNGSGKTALVEAVNIFKDIVLGQQLEENVTKLISVDESCCSMEFTLYLEYYEHKYIINYEFEITKKENEKSVVVSKEKLSYAGLENNKWKKTGLLIDYDYNYDNKSLIKPSYRYNRIIAKNKDAFLKLNVSKELSKKTSTSFLFSKETIEVLSSSCDENDDINIILNCLRNFAEVNLFVITNKSAGAINMNLALPISFSYEEDDTIISGDVAVQLFGSSLVPQNIYNVLAKIIDQINIVVGTIIPNMQLELFDYGKKYIDDKKLGEQIEFLSVRDGKKIPLSNESDGIKKIISILSAIISMYNKQSVTVVIDELDSGVFEYLLGEILEVLDKGAQGQFIFTSHNLRPLEKLNKDSIVFTTSNPVCRYIRLENVKSNNNLRDFYLRGISLGGQKETIYEETNTFEIQHALKLAGRENDAN